MSFTEIHDNQPPSPESVFDMTTPPEQRSDPFAAEEADAAAALARANEMVQGEHPTIDSPPEMVEELPRGLHRNGAWLTRVEMRELTGADEEILARYKNPVDYFDGVLACGVARLGDVRFSDVTFEERVAMLSNLLVGEREILYLAVCRTTFGRYKDLGYNCDVCQAKTEVTLDLATDFPAKPMEDPHRPYYEYKASNGKMLHYRLAVGGDQAEVMRKGGSTATANTEIISRCVIEIDGKPNVDPQGFAKSLGMRDREALINEMMAHQPQPDMTVKFACAACGDEKEVFVPWDRLFRP